MWIERLRIERGIETHIQEYMSLKLNFPNLGTVRDGGVSGMLEVSQEVLTCIQHRYTTEIEVKKTETGYACICVNTDIGRKSLYCKCCGRSYDGSVWVDKQDILNYLQEQLQEVAKEVVNQTEEERNLDGSKIGRSLGLVTIHQLVQEITEESPSRPVRELHSFRCKLCKKELQYLQKYCENCGECIQWE